MKKTYIQYNNTQYELLAYDNTYLYLKGLDKRILYKEASKITDPSPRLQEILVKNNWESWDFYEEFLQF